MRIPSLLAPVSLGLVAALPISGCAQVDDIKNTVNGLTNTMVVESLLLGVEAPDTNSKLDLSGSDFAQGTTVKAFLADASDPTSLTDAPVKGAAVNFVSDGNGGQLALKDNDDGSYSANENDQGLVYVAEQVSLSADYGDTIHSISVNAPPLATVDIGANHTAGDSLTIDISDQDYDGLLVVVLSGPNVDLSFSNIPTSIDEVYNFTHGDSPLTVDIPGDTFSDAGLYAVGVAGTRNAGSDDMTQVNTVLSTFVGGQFKFYTMTVN
ncbi:MAG: hypothetical protein GXP62_19525 [Oligoflexia bacterium]|nr:hypothetical protein [Oligoflexia bacterium]